MMTQKDDLASLRDRLARVERGEVWFGLCGRSSVFFAHKRRDATVEAILAKTNIEEIKDLLGFLAGLHSALDQLYLNGQQPIVHVRKFTLPPKTSSLSPGERVYAEGHEALRMVSLPDPDELRYNAGMIV